MVSGRSRSLVLSLAICATAGCVSEETRAILHAADQDADIALDKVQQKSIERPARQALIVSDDLYIPSTLIRLDKGRPLPAALQGEGAMTIVIKAPSSIGYIAGRIAAASGLPVRVIDGADRPISPAFEDGFNHGAAGQNPAPRSGAAPSPATPSTTVQTSFLSGMAVRYVGPLSGILDLVAAHFGVSWRFDGSAIIFYRYETRVFTIAALPGTQTLKDDLSDATAATAGPASAAPGSQGATSTGISQNASSIAQSDYWTDLGRELSALLVGDGAFTIAPSTGAVTIIANPDTMRRVASFVKAENDRLKQQVSIQVEIWTMNTQRNLDTGIDFSAIFSQPNWPSLGFTGVPSIVDATGSGGFSATVVNPPPGSLLSKFNGSQIAFHALHQDLQAERKVTIPMLTLNNRAIAKARVLEQSYLYSVATTATGVIAAAPGSPTTIGGTTLIPGSVPSGIRLNMLPRILDGGEIMLRYSVSQTQLRQFRTFSSGGNQIQLPDVDKDADLNEAILVSGATLFLTGFVQRDHTGNESGVMPGLIGRLLGGGAMDDASKLIIVIAITPRLFDPLQQKPPAGEG